MHEKTAPLSTNEKQKNLRDKRYQAGFRQLNEWIHDMDRESLKEYARLLRQKRWKVISDSRGEK